MPVGKGIVNWVGQFRGAQTGRLRSWRLARNPLARRRHAGRIIATKLGRHESRPAESRSIVMKKTEHGANQPASGINRREFVGMAAGALALSAFPYSRVLGANNRIRIGLIGAGDRGQQDLKDAIAQPDVSVSRSPTSTPFAANRRRRLRPLPRRMTIPAACSIAKTSTPSSSRRRCICMRNISWTRWPPARTCTAKKP